MALEGGPFLDFGYTGQRVEEPELGDWRARFEPASPGMHPTRGHDELTLHLGLSIRAGVAPGPSWALLGVVQQYVPWTEQVRSVEIEWWDRVTGADVALSKPWPSIGVASFVRAGSQTFADATVTAQRYELLERQHTGIDCHDCANSSEVTASRRIDAGWLFRPEMAYVWCTRVGIAMGGGAYAEFGDAPVWQAGLSLRLLWTRRCSESVNSSERDPAPPVIAVLPNAVRRE